jgi:hypothetical protein
MIIKNAAGKCMNNVKVFDSLKYKPHKSQSIIHNSTARFRYLCCGRRWGKTLLASKELFLASVKPEQRFWVVAPTYGLTEKVFREIYKDFQYYYPHWVERASESDMRIKLKNNTIIECKSADNPDSLLGEGIDGMIVDEAARVKDDIWQTYLRATLSDRQGWLLAISTPRGMNWFYRGFQEGQDKVNDTESWNFTSADNPYMPAEEIELAKRTLPERVFKQEFLGLFLSGVGGVFRNISDCLGGSLNELNYNSRYVIGVDLAKYQDFTVIIVLDLISKQVVYFDRFNQIDWTLQEMRIIEIWKKYLRCQVVVDATGVGDRVYEELSKTINNLYGYQIKGSNKNELIDNLALLFDNKQIKIPAEASILINELNIFEYNLTAAGNYKLEAPKGYHDDCVIALALACSVLRNVEIDNFPIA